MMDDFDENTLETIEPIITMRKHNSRKLVRELIDEYFDYKKGCDCKSNQKIKHLAELRKKLHYANIWIVTRKLYEKSSNEQIEAWLTKFNDIIIDDTEKPYKPLYSNKEKAIYVAKQFNRTNLDKGLALIHKSTDTISKFANSFDFGNSPKKRIRF